MAEIRAIETEYNGYRFRSRLEARWAVAFDAMGIKYEYEPEGYVLHDGTLYLPDFKLTNVRRRNDGGEPKPLYVEVKGAMTPEDMHKIEMFPYGIVVIGNIPQDGYDALNESWRGGCTYWSFLYLDDDYFPGVFCKHRGNIWFAGSEHNEFDLGKLMDVGISAAKHARFEHGEHGFDRRKP